jgi:two-component system, LytTR family, sensor kinase
MMRNFYIANNRLLTHILFWAGIVLLNVFVYGSYEEKYLRQLYIETASLPVILFVAYINMGILIPRFLVRKKYAAYIFSVLVVLFTGSLFNRMVYLGMIAPKYFPNEVSVPFFTIARILKTMFWTLNPIIFLTSGIKLFKKWYNQEQQSQELAKEKLGAELNYLKGQVHPHFLFNTLNNLYSLTLKKSDTAPKVVLKLSELMSYMLYDSQATIIPLNKEISHIKNYIELEKIRYGNRLDVSLNVSGDTNGKNIAPLLLIPFVENAFKHGVSNETENAWVTIDIKVKDELLTVKVENSRSHELTQADKSGYKNGIGLQNVVRRLELLYNGNHELQMEKESDRYLVDLKIHLNGKE